MDVSSVMNNYNLASLWNNLSTNTNSNSNIFSMNNIDESVKENYSEKQYFGENSSSELQDIYKQTEPDYGIDLEYDKNGNLSIPTTSSTDLYSNNGSNIISLLKENNSSSDNFFSDVLFQYNSIEDGSYNGQISSMLSNNPSDLYSYIDSLGNNKVQSLGNYIDASL